MFILFLAVSAIFYSAALWDSVCEYLINLHRSEEFFGWSRLILHNAHTHSFTKSHKHILFFYISCVNMYNVSVTDSPSLLCLLIVLMKR